MPEQFLHSDLTFKIRGCCFEVMKQIGSGQKENVYQQALHIEFTSQKITFVEEPRITIFYKGKKVGVYRPDFVIDEKVLVELKSVPFLATSAYQQFRQYLCSTKYEVGLLVNFGQPTLTFRRETWFNKKHNV